MSAEAYYRALALRAQTPEEKAAVANRFAPDQPHGSDGQFGKVGVKRPHVHRPAGTPLPAGGVSHEGQPPTTTATAPPPAAQAPAIQVPGVTDPGQQQALQQWLGQGHDAIAAAARTSSGGKQAKAIAAIDAAIVAAPARDSDTTGYRGLPPDIKEPQPHSIFRVPGYLSLSTQPLAPGTPSMAVTVPAAIPALQLPGELLLGRGCHLRVDMAAPLQMTVVQAPQPKDKQAARMATQFGRRYPGVAQAVTVFSVQAGYEKAANEVRAVLALLDENPEVAVREVAVHVRGQGLDAISDALSCITGHTYRTQSAKSWNSEVAWLGIPIAERMRREAYLRSQGVDVEALNNP